MNVLNNSIQDYCNEVFYIEPFKQLIKKLESNEYIPIKIKEGCLLDDIMFIHLNTIKAYINNTFNPKKIFIFKETFINSQSSTYTVLKYNKLKKYHIDCLIRQGFID